MGLSGREDRRVRVGEWRVNTLCPGKYRSGVQGFDTVTHSNQIALLPCVVYVVAMGDPQGTLSPLQEALTGYHGDVTFGQSIEGKLQLILGDGGLWKGQPGPWWAW